MFARFDLIKLQMDKTCEFEILIVSQQATSQEPTLSDHKAIYRILEFMFNNYIAGGFLGVLSYFSQYRVKNQIRQKCSPMSSQSCFVTLGRCHPQSVTPW